MPRTGRPPGRPDNRARILAAARECFGQAGFEGATMRAIGAGAGVDPALVHHYFGSKEALYLRATELPLDIDELLAEVLSSGPRELGGPSERRRKGEQVGPGEPGGPGGHGVPADLGERLVRTVLERWEQPGVRPVVLGVLRSATTDARAAELLRTLISERILGPLTRSLGVPDADLRASLAGSQMVGLVLARMIVGIEPLASAPLDTVAAAVGPTIQRYLTGELMPRAPAAPGPRSPATAPGRPPSRPAAGGPRASRPRSGRGPARSR